MHNRIEVKIVICQIPRGRSSFAIFGDAVTASTFHRCNAGRKRTCSQKWEKKMKELLTQEILPNEITKPNKKTVKLRMTWLFPQKAAE